MRGAISEILRHLYIGTIYAAQSEDILRDNQIEHVISILDEDDFFNPVHHVKYLRYNIYDEPDEDIVPICEDVYTYLECNHQKDNPVKILVHCAEGRSRSVCVVAYFLTRYGMFNTVDDALEFIKERRLPVNIRPNVFFVDQITRKLKYKK